MATGGDLHSCFKEYATKENNAGMTTKDVTQLFTHAKLMKKTGKWTSNNLDITFTKCKTKGKNFITFEQFEKLLPEMCEPKDDLAEIKAKLAGTKKADHIKAVTSKTGGVARMTDASKYTGAHKERFNEDGTGKGAEGRTDKTENTGYTGQYKGKDTFDKK